MDTILIKTHQPGAHYAKPHFSSLSKGLNSGKPQKRTFYKQLCTSIPNRSSKEDIFGQQCEPMEIKCWHHLSGRFCNPIQQRRTTSTKEFNNPSSNPIDARTPATQKTMQATKAAAEEQENHQPQNLHNSHQRTQNRHYDEYRIK